MCFMGRGESQTQVEFSAGRKWNNVCGISTICAQQTAKNWRKSPKGFFGKLKRRISSGNPPLLFDIPGNYLEMRTKIQHFIWRLLELLSSRRAWYTFIGKIKKGGMHNG